MDSWVDEVLVGLDLVGFEGVEVIEDLLVSGCNSN